MQGLLQTVTQGPTIALISGRTADNPRLLKEVIEAGCTHVYLEKPGAPTVGELEEMVAFAKSKGVPVYMGYNKNVTPCTPHATKHATARRTPHAARRKLRAARRKLRA